MEVSRPLLPRGLCDSCRRTIFRCHHFPSIKLPGVGPRVHNISNDWHLNTIVSSRCSYEIDCTVEIRSASGNVPKRVRLSLPLTKKKIPRRMKKSNIDIFLWTSDYQVLWRLLVSNIYFSGGKASTSTPAPPQEPKAKDGEKLPKRRSRSQRVQWRATTMTRARRSRRNKLERMASLAHRGEVELYLGVW